LSEKRRNSFIVQGSILALAGILTKVIGFVYRIPMANLLGNEGNGIYSVAYGIYNIALTLSTMGLPLAVSKTVSARLAKNEYRNSTRVLRNAFILALILGAGAACALFFGAGALETFYARPGLARPLRVLAPVAFIFALLGVFRGYSQGNGTMVPTALSQVVDQCFNAVVSVAAAYMLMTSFAADPEVASYGAMGGTIGTLAGGLASLIYLLINFARRFPFVRRRDRLDDSGRVESNGYLTKVLILTILPVILSQTIYQIGYTIDDFIFGNFMKSAGVESAVTASLQGVFNTQYNQLVNLPVAISTAMAISLMPSIVASHVRGERSEVRRQITATLKINMAFVLPCVVGLAVLADPIMTVLFPALGEYHDTAAALLRWGSAAAALYALSTLTTSMLQGTNHMRIPVYHSAISLAIHVALIVILLRAGLGVWALLIGNVTFPLVISLLNCRSVTRHLRYRWDLFPTFVTPLVCSLLMGLFCHYCYVLTLALSHHHIVALAAAIVLSMLVYGLVLLKSHCFTKRELLALPMGGRIFRLAVKLHL
jgi:stage V sporulation protein B